MKTKLLGLVVAIFFSIVAYAQNHDYAMIYIYRTGGLAVNYEYPVIFNKVIIHKLPVRNKLSYKMYSKGLLQMELAGNVKIDLNIEPGKSYYIKCPNNGVSKLVSEEIGKKDFNSEKDRPDLYTYLEEDIENPIIRNSNSSKKYFATEEKKSESIKKYANSDVDINIPFAEKKNENKYALIIGNEDYSTYQTGLTNESNVEFAVNDARIFKEYAKATLGIPEENIIYLENAKAVEMSRALKTLVTVIKNTNGKGDILFYYAGHGFPNEIDNEPYLIPVDVSGSDLQFAVKLKDLYTQLSDYPSQKVTIFLDACFSGGSRNQGLIAARGVKIKPKENILKGNLIVFSASSGEQSSLAYKDKSHGLFTYYLLKKLQETNGNINYKDLSEYLTEQVSIKSALINQKEQNPQTLISISNKDTWGTWKIK
ncbi:MAG: caspase domain-containing protein [Bacteroidales bacterium]